MKYLCEASSLEGFVQQIACNYLPHGYWFFVTGHVPDRKRARYVDEKLVAKYGIDVSRATRSRRKLAGNANLHYIRHERLFVLLATHGKHLFFDEEHACIRDVREAPIQYGGYSISYRRGGRTRDGKPDPKWHSHIEIARAPYKDLEGYYLDMARHRNADWLAQEFYQFPFEPYAPIRRQMLVLLRKVNRVRKRAGYTMLPPDVLPMRRRVVKPFGASRTGTGSTQAECAVAKRRSHEAIACRGTRPRQMA
jgi:hypothetical protein